MASSTGSIRRYVFNRPRNAVSTSAKPSGARSDEMIGASSSSSPPDDDVDVAGEGKGCCPPKPGSAEVSLTG